MPKQRPTLRSLAAEAGVSLTTVSFALRNSPEVSEATRRRLQRLARMRGYRPNPHLARFMSQLRAGAQSGLKANVCALGQIWGPQPRQRGNYFDRLAGGLRERSAALGCAFSFLNLDDYPQASQLQRVLESRGVEGLFLLPLREASDLRERLDWSGFSVVAVTSSLTAPRFHSVMPAHFENVLAACRELHTAGYRRVGLALSRMWDVRVQHRWTGAIAWHNAHGGMASVRTLLYDKSGAEFDARRWYAWLRRERPDVVLYEGFDRQRCEAIACELPLRQRPRFVTLNWPAWPGDSGIDQCVERIGAVAAELLAAMIARGEKGVPEEPTSTLVGGKWRERG